MPINGMARVVFFPSSNCKTDEFLNLFVCMNYMCQYTCIYNRKFGELATLRVSSKSHGRNQTSKQKLVSSLSTVVHASLGVTLFMTLINFLDTDTWAGITKRKN